MGDQYEEQVGEKRGEGDPGQEQDPGPQQAPGQQREPGPHRAPDRQEDPGPGAGYVSPQQGQQGA